MGTSAHTHSPGPEGWVTVSGAETDDATSWGWGETSVSSEKFRLTELSSQEDVRRPPLVFLGSFRCSNCSSPLNLKHCGFPKLAAAWESELPRAAMVQTESWSVSPRKALGHPESHSLLQRRPLVPRGKWGRQSVWKSGQRMYCEIRQAQCEILAAPLHTSYAPAGKLFKPVALKVWSWDPWGSPKTLSGHPRDWNYFHKNSKLLFSFFTLIPS